MAIDMNGAVSYARIVVREADAGRCDAPRTEQLARALLALQPEPSRYRHDMKRPGAEVLDGVRQHAEYWLNGGRNEPNRAEAVMAVEQAVNSWKNAAYSLAEKLAWLPVRKDALPHMGVHAGDMVLGWLQGSPTPDVVHVNTIHKWALADDPMTDALWMPIPERK